jgi:hypothetical protein
LTCSILLGNYSVLSIKKYEITVLSIKKYVESILFIGLFYALKVKKRYKKNNIFIIDQLNYEKHF